MIGRLFSHESMLHRCIDEEDWNAAMECLDHHPNEAWTWAEVQFDGESDRTSRMLPLHRVVQSSSAPLEFVKKLVDAFPKAIRRRDSYFLRYPLHFACSHSPYPELIMYLIEKNKTVVSCGDRYDRIPLHYACFGKAHEYVIHTLLDIFPGGAQCPDTQGWLPLHVAVRYGCSDSSLQRIVRAYPKALETTSHKGKTPLDLYTIHEARHNDSIASLLSMTPAAFKRTSSLFGDGNDPDESVHLKVSEAAIAA